MQMNYQQLRKRVSDQAAKSPAASSNKKRVLDILTVAQQWGIDTAAITPINFSNMAEIIFEANKAIKDGDRKRLDELFYWGGCMSNANLKLALRNNRERVLVLNGRPDQYEMTLTAKQMANVEKKTRQNMEFQVIPRK
jgi:hypothetical protein